MYAQKSYRSELFINVAPQTEIALLQTYAEIANIVEYMYYHILIIFQILASSEKEIGHH